MKKFNFLFLGLFCANSLYAQHISFFKETFISDAIILKELKRDYKKYKVFEQDLTMINNWFKNNLHHYTDKSHKYEFSIPIASNQFIDFELFNSGILSEEYLSNNNTTRAYKGISKDKRYTTRITISTIGILAKITDISTGQSYYIQPLNHNNKYLIIYQDSDLINSSTFSCNSIENSNVRLDNNIDNEKMVALGDCTLKSFRMAVAATAEYTNAAGGVLNARNYITQTINTITEIYERDLTVTFSLLLNDENIFTSTSANGYPYTQTSLNSQLLTENHNHLNSKFGNNYDLGNLFGYGPGFSGGLAELQSVCYNYGKGRSASGLNANFGSQALYGPLLEQTIAHETGHQFGATHTMSANTSSCGGNNHSATSNWEAGGGSTIMAYSSACNPLYYDVRSSHFFHAGSLIQMNNYINSYTACAVRTTSNNTNPIVSNLQYIIPTNTPFKLTIDASDAENNNLTYSFDQYDLYGGTGTNTTPQPTATFGPLFKTLVPSTNNFRYFPSLSTLISGTNDPYEVLPTVSRNINFLGLVRDNNLDAGCVAYSNIRLTVDNACGDFKITSHNTSASNNLIADGSNTTTLTWNTASCVYSGNVNIKFSTDSGMTYPYTILANTPNDGSETFIVPNLVTCNGRFLIEPINNVFFSINESPIIITSNNSLAKGLTIQPSNTVTAEEGNATLNLITNPVYGTAISSPIVGTLNVSNTSNLSFINGATNSCSGPSNSNYYHAIEFIAGESKNYTFTFSAGFYSLINLYNNSFDPNIVCNNFITSSAILPNGSSFVTLNNSISQNLCAGQKYVLVFESFSQDPSAVISSFSITSNGLMFANAVNPPAHYAYGYVITDLNSNNIVSIQSNTDLSNRTKFPTGNYKIEGISSNQALATLNSTYIGQSWHTLNSDILNQANNLDAQLSNNQRLVNIESPLPIKLWEFNVYKNNNDDAQLNWEMTEDELLHRYELQKSLDGINFETIAHVKPNNNNNFNDKYLYTYIDKTFKTNRNNKAYYRIGFRTKLDEVTYSPIKYLSNQYNSIIKVYPNPIEGNELNIMINDDYIGNITLSIIDQLGRIIHIDNANKDLQQHQHILYLKNLHNGIYHLRIVMGDQVETIKVIK